MHRQGRALMLIAGLLGPGLAPAQVRAFAAES